MSTKIISVDHSKDNDYTGVAIIDTKNHTIKSIILRTDNPDPNSWLYGFMEDSKIINNEMQNK